MREGPLQLSDASFQKHGDALRAQARASRADVGEALGEGVEVRLLSSDDGQVEVSVSGGLFGVQASVDAVARAQEGKLVVHPTGFLLEGLKLTLFDNPRVYVEGVGASAVAGASGLSGEVAAALQAVDLGEPALSGARVDDHRQTVLGADRRHLADRRAGSRRAARA